MAYENFPSAETTPPVIPPKPKTDTWKTFTIAGLALALMGTWGYLIYDKNTNKQTIQQKDTLIAGATSEKDNLQKELEDAEFKFDQLKSSSANEMARKDSTITAKDRDINAKKDRIRQLLAKANASKEELAEAKSLIASLNTDITTYKADVERLTGENIKLTQEKEQVTKERDDVKKNYEDAKTDIKQKEEKIDIGSTLHASEFQILGINEKRGDKERRTESINKADLMRISFFIDDNRITTSGPKDILVCITTPDGTPLSVEAYGSGTFTTRDNEQKVYTKKVTIDYVQGERKYVTFDWKQDSKFQVGDYKIEVYQNGFKIGNATKTFRKGGLFG